MMDGNGHGRPLQRARSANDASSVSRSRKREKLCDLARSIRPLGRAFVDDGYAMSPALAAIVSTKAFRLRITVTNKQSEEDETYVGQAGLVRGERLTPSPPAKKQAVGEGESDRPVPVSIVRSSHFKAVPITALHNVVTETNTHGDLLEFHLATLVSPTRNEKIVHDFSKAGYELTLGDAFVIRPGDESGEEKIEWEYGHDVDSAAELDNPTSHFTKKECSYEKMERTDFRFQAGQKVGIAIYRDFMISSEDTGISNLTEEDIQRIYGRMDQVNIYTGEITRVCEGGDCFEHNINTFSGCSGALVFLLDKNQEGFGVVDQDHGKAIAVHVGGDEVGGGTVSNFAFKIL
mmetsp:Transcript_46239/g.112932  ORF Transcript_46239/g.112932 Transcript_46239/m.112932 type:complete len:348 (+) Transcript_46239:31-1074(+)